MSKIGLPLGILAARATFVSIVLLTTLCAAQQETVIHSFPDGSDGLQPLSPLIVDASGNLFGTTSIGGGCPDITGGGCGTVFELSPKPGGGYTETVLHVFGHGNDGRVPLGRLVMDNVGNLYGTTTEGGDYVLRGTVFELSPKVGGGYEEKVLHSFLVGYDPLAGVILDAAGNLYGTTYLGGSSRCNGLDGCGTVFKLAPDGKGGWTETTLHVFEGGSDGAFPIGGLVMDRAGNLYGTTSRGGRNNTCTDCGTIFRLVPEAGGGYRESVLHSFHGIFDGAEPHSGLIIDAAGKLYGTASRGGNYDNCAIAGTGCGTVFSINRNGSGWTVRGLHSFGNLDTHDGSLPLGDLIIDSAGNLYGTTRDGGNRTGEGTVFKLSPTSTNRYSETVLYNFAGGSDGKSPYAGLAMDSAGNLYGTTFSGGIHIWGTAFKIAP